MLKRFSIRGGAKFRVDVCKVYIYVGLYIKRKHAQDKLIHFFCPVLKTHVISSILHLKYTLRFSSLTEKHRNSVLTF